MILNVAQISAFLIFPLDCFRANLVAYYILSASMLNKVVSFIKGKFYEVKEIG
jgi:hypothetical protein